MAPKVDKTAEPKSVEKTAEVKEAIDAGEEEVVEKATDTEKHEVVDGDGTKEVADKVGENTTTATVNTPADTEITAPATQDEAVELMSKEWSDPDDAYAAAQEKWPELFEDEGSDDEHEASPGKKTRGTGEEDDVLDKDETFLDSNGVPATAPFGGVDPESNPKDGPVNTASDPHRKTTEISPRDNLARATGGLPATDQPDAPIGGTRRPKYSGVSSAEQGIVNPEAGTKAARKEEAVKQATQLSSKQINRGIPAGEAAFAKLAGFIDSYPDDTPDDHTLWGAGGITVTMGDMRHLLGVGPSYHRDPQALEA